MPDKRLLYFTSLRTVAYCWRNGRLAREEAFSLDENGVAAFSRYVAAAPDSLFYVLADVVEEDFFQENIPYIRGADRRTLLARKLAQRYRDTSLALALSLGTETEDRREERILYSSFTNTQQFQPWLDALRSSQARVAGVYSVALTAPLVGKSIGFRAPRYLLVSLQQGGLRQSFVENGRIRFSRLGRIDLSDPRAVAQACAAESARIQQYLTNMRMVEREAPPLDVIVLAPSEYKSLYDAACVNAAQLQFHVLDLDQVGRRTGLKSAPEETLAEGLFLHLLAVSRAGEQYADDSLRRFYDLWRARVGLITAGAAALALCLALSGLTLFDTYQVDQQAEADRQQEAAASRQYARTKASFPPTPTLTENLKIIVKNYLSVLRQSASPSNMFVDISQALANSPQIELEKLDWEISTPKTAAGGRDAPKAPDSTAPAAEPRYQVAEISGRLLVPQASDYRNITMLMDRFVEALRSRPGMEVVSTRLPFDINAEKSISGDIGVERGAEVPRFSVVVSKRLGT
ncbi:MAG: hypothetical protein WBM28_17865 [Burkholderiales bacterium]